MSDDKAKIMERIRKLFALASANPSESEALAAMDKARKLMVDHNFNQVEIDQVESQYVTKGYRSSSGRANTKNKRFFKSKELCAPVAKLNDCIAFTKHKEGRTCFFGEAHDVEVCIFTMHLLQNSFVSAWHEYLRSTDLELASGSVASQKTSFENGMLFRLSARLNEMIKAKEVQVARYTGGTALMVAKGKAVSSAFDDKFDMPEGRAKHFSSNDRYAARAGYEAGGRVNICTGIDEDYVERLAAE